MKLPTFLALCALAAWPLRSFAAEVPPAELPEVHHYVYLSELPSPEDLMKDAATNGLTVARIDKTADRVVVTYKYADGRLATLGYALLSSAGNDRVVARLEPQAVVERRTEVVTREPEVIYVDRPYRSRVIYSDPIDDFWLPLTLGVGLGWATTWHGHHGHYHGGWHRR